MRARGHHGAATVEMVGIAAAVSLLIAASAVWIHTNAGVDGHPPRLVERLAAPIAPVEGAPYLDLDRRLPPWPRYSNGSGIIDGVAADWWAILASELELADGRVDAFVDGFRRCLVQDARAYFEDPLGRAALQLAPPTGQLPGPRPDDLDQREEWEGKGRLERAIETLRPSTPGVVEDWLVTYGAKFRGKSARAQSETFNREAGCLAYDLAVSRATGRAKRALGRRIEDRLDGGGGTRGARPPGGAAPP